MDTAGTIAIVTLICSIFGAAMTMAYFMGRLSQRVDGLEQWRDEVRGEFHTLHGALRHIEVLIKNGDS